MKLNVTELRLSDVFLDMVRVHQSHRPGIPAGKICRVRHGSKSVLLVARGARANQRTSVSVDLKTRKALGISKFGEEADVTFHRATLWDEMVWGWHTSEPATRIAFRLGAISLILGLVGIILGAWSAWLTVVAMTPPLEASARSVIKPLSDRCVVTGASTPDKTATPRREP